MDLLEAHLKYLVVRQWRSNEFYCTLFFLETTNIPEFNHLPKWWDQRARGLGGEIGRPMSCGGEENVLCLRSDRYYGDDIFFHEAAHNVAVSSLFHYIKI